MRDFNQQGFEHPGESGKMLDSVILEDDLFSHIMELTSFHQNGTSHLTPEDGQSLPASQNGSASTVLVGPLRTWNLDQKTCTSHQVEPLQKWTFNMSTGRHVFLANRQTRGRIGNTHIHTQTHTDTHTHTHRYIYIDINSLPVVQFILWRVEWCWNRGWVRDGAVQIYPEGLSRNKSRNILV